MAQSLHNVRRSFRVCAAIFPLVLAVLGGWSGRPKSVADEMEPCAAEDSPRSQQEAVAAIEKLGGFVWAVPEGPRGPMGEQMERLVGVDLRLSDVTDAEMANLARLASVETISLFATEITDAGLVHLKGLTNLEELSIEATRVKGPGLKHLKQLPKLRSLNAGSTRVTDRSLRHLTELKSLEELDLS